MPQLPDMFNCVAHMRDHNFVGIMLKPTQAKGQRIKVLKVVRVHVSQISILRTLPKNVRVGT